MNEQVLLSYVSRQLHTYIEKYDSTGQLLFLSSERKDLKDPLSDKARLLRAFGQPHYFSAHSVRSKAPLLLCLPELLVYGYVPIPDGFYLVGPVRFSVSDTIPISCYDLEVIPEHIDSVAVLRFDFYMQNVLLLYNVHQKQDSIIPYQDYYKDYILTSSLSDSVHKDFSRTLFQNQETGQRHNPYEQEYREQSSIENGDLESLRRSIAEDYSGNYGTLSHDSLRNVKNLSIVVITLSSRSAIRGGLSAELAFSLSDSYIQKIEQLRDENQLIQLVRDAEFHYASLVRERREQTKKRQKETKNPYIELCKDYIFSHLHGKLTVAEIAQSLHINANYLSELFVKHEGITLSQYIISERINRARNMLVYSDYSFIEIATYLGFSSQSHLGSHFKKETGYTLKQYRDLYKKNGENTGK